jgi:3-hydroxyacyl-CoA dehydrogenase
LNFKESSMAKDKQIQNVAIVGTGVIGASWAAYYLSRGLDVIATDPAPIIPLVEVVGGAKTSPTNHT